MAGQVLPMSQDEVCSFVSGSRGAFLVAVEGAAGQRLLTSQAFSTLFRLLGSRPTPELPPLAPRCRSIRGRATPSMWPWLMARTAIVASEGGPLAAGSGAED